MGSQRVGDDLVTQQHFAIFPHLLTSKEWNNIKPLLFFLPTPSFWPSPDFVKALTPWSFPSPSCVSAKARDGWILARGQEGRFSQMLCLTFPRIPYSADWGPSRDCFPQYPALRVCLRQQDLNFQALWISNLTPRQEQNRVLACSVPIICHLLISHMGLLKTKTNITLHTHKTV